MQKLIVAAALAAVTVSANASLIITGVIDGPRTGGLPKATEIYVAANIADATQYGISTANNGGAVPATPEFILPAGSLTGGAFINIASEVPGFTAFFGFAPTYTTGAMNINGDDVVVIQQFVAGSWVVVDAYGTVGTAPTADTSWNHLDSWAYRADGTGPDATFDLADWFFPPGQSDALDILGSAGVNPEIGSANEALRFPVGSYTPAVIPEPTGLAAVALAGLAAVRRRRA
jgi:hypothetical protein